MSTVCDGKTGNSYRCDNVPRIRPQEVTRGCVSAELGGNEENGETLVSGPGWAPIRKGDGSVTFLGKSQGTLRQGDGAQGDVTEKKQQQQLICWMGRTRRDAHIWCVEFCKLVAIT